MSITRPSPAQTTSGHAAITYSLEVGGRPKALEYPLIREFSLA
jgi:hypothetical protein